MNVAVQILLLVVGVLVVLGTIAGVVVLIYRGKYRAAAGRLRTELAAETIVRPFESGNYRGATAPGYPRVKNNGRIALTRRRLVFLTLTGTTISVPLDSITGLRLAKVFKGSVAGGWTHLVIRTAGGEIGFYVKDTGSWLHSLGEATGLSPEPTGAA